VSHTKPWLFRSCIACPTARQA